MDFHGMNRKELQALCKKHNIPANLKNVEMADRLASLLKVEDETPKEPGVKPCLKNMEELRVIEEEVRESKAQKKVRFSPQNETLVYEKTNPRAARVATRRGNSKALGEDVSVIEDVKAKGKTAADVQTRKQDVKKRRCGLGKGKLLSVEQVGSTEVGDLVDTVSEAVDIKNSLSNDSCVVEDLCAFDGEISEAKEPKNARFSPQNQTVGFEITNTRAVRASTRRLSMAVGDIISKERNASVLEDGKGKGRKNATDEQTRKQGVKNTMRGLGKRKLSSVEQVGFSEEVGDLLDPVSEAVDIKNSLSNDSCVVEDLCAFDGEISEAKETKNAKFSPQNQTVGFEKTNPRAVRASTRRLSMALGVDIISKERNASVPEDGKGKGRKNATDEQTRKQGVKNTMRGLGKRKLSTVEQVGFSEEVGDLLDPVSEAVDIKNSLCNDSCVVKDLCVIDEEISEGKEPTNVGINPPNQTFGFEKNNTRPVRASTRRLSMAVGVDRISKEKGRKNATDEQTRKQGVKNTMRGLGKRKLSTVEQVGFSEEVGDLLDPVSEAVDIKNSLCNDSCAVKDLCVIDEETSEGKEPKNVGFNLQNQTFGFEKTNARPVRASTRRLSMVVGVDRISKEKGRKNATDEQIRKQGVKKTRCAGKRKLSAVEHVEDLETETLGKSADVVDNSEVGGLANSVSEAVDIQNTLCNDSSAVEDNQGKTQPLLQTKSPSPLLDKCNSKKDVEGSFEESTLVYELETVLPSPMVVESEPDNEEGSSMKSTQVEDRCEVAILSSKRDEMTRTNNNLESAQLEKCIIPDLCNLEGQVSRDSTAEVESSPNINECLSSLQKPGDSTDDKCIDHLVGENEGYDQDAEGVTPTASINVDTKYSEAIVDSVISDKTEYSAESEINHKHRLERILYPETVDEQANDIAAENDEVVSIKAPEGRAITDVPDAELGDSHEAYKSDRSDYSAEPDVTYKEGLEDALNSETIGEEGIDMAAEDDSVMSSKGSEGRTVTDVSDPEMGFRAEYSAEPDLSHKQGLQDALNAETIGEEGSDMAAEDDSVMSSKGSEERAVTNVSDHEMGYRAEYSAELDVSDKQGFQDAINSETIGEEGSDMAAEDDSVMSSKGSEERTVTDVSDPEMGYRAEYSAEPDVSQKQGLEGILNSEAADEEGNCIIDESDSVVRNKAPERRSLIDVSYAFNTGGSESPVKSELSHKQGLEVVLHSETIDEKVNGIADEIDSTVKSEVPEMGDNHEAYNSDRTGYSAKPEDHTQRPESVLNSENMDEVEERNGIAAEYDSVVRSKVPERTMIDGSDAELGDNHEDFKSDGAEYSAEPDVSHKQGLEGELNPETIAEEGNGIAAENDIVLSSKLPEGRIMTDASDVDLDDIHDAYNSDRSEYPDEPEINHKQGVEFVLNSETTDEDRNGIAAENHDAYTEDGSESPDESDINQKQGGDEAKIQNIHEESTVMITGVHEERSKLDVSDVKLRYSDDTCNNDGSEYPAESDINHKQGNDESKFELTLDGESYGIDTLFELGDAEDGKNLIKVSNDELDKKISSQREDIVLPLSSELKTTPFKGMSVPRSCTEGRKTELANSASKFNLYCQSAPPSRSSSLDKLGMFVPVSEGFQGTYHQQHETTTSSSMIAEYEPYNGDAFSNKKSETEEGTIQDFCNLESQVDIANVKSFPNLEEFHSSSHKPADTPGMSPMVSNLIVETEEETDSPGSNDSIVEKIGTPGGIDNYISAISHKLGDKEEKHSVDDNMIDVNVNLEDTGMPDQGMEAQFQEFYGKNVGYDQDAEVVSPTNTIIEIFESSEAIASNISAKSENAAESEAGQAHVPEGVISTDASCDQLNDNNVQKGDRVEYILEDEQAATALICGSSEVSENENPGNTFKCQRSNEQGLLVPNNSQLTPDLESYDIASLFQSEFAEDVSGLVHHENEALPGENMEVDEEKGAMETCTDTYEIVERLADVSHSIDWEEFPSNCRNNPDIVLQGSEEKSTNQSSDKEKISDENGTCIESRATVEIIAPSTGCAEPEEDLIGLAVFERLTEQTVHQTTNENFAITYDPEAEGANGENFELIHDHKELDDQCKSANVEGIFKEEETLPLNGKVPDTKLEKVENCELIADLKGLVHPELSMAEIDDKDISKEDKISHLNDEAAELKKLEDEISSLIDEAAEEDIEKALNDEVADINHEKLENCELIHDLKGLAQRELSMAELDDLCKSANVKDISMEDEILPLNDKAADTKLEKAENCEGLVLHDLSMTEIEDQSESANVKDISEEDKISHLNDDAADAELDEVEVEISPLNDEAADAEIDNVEGEILPVNDEVADTQLQKVENCKLIPDLKGLVHPELSMTELDVKDISKEDKMLHLNVEAAEPEKVEDKISTLNDEDADADADLDMVEGKFSPLNDEAADTKLVKAENCELIPDIKGLVHHDLSMAEIDDQCESANVKAAEFENVEDEVLPLNDEDAVAELYKVESKISPLNDEAVDTNLASEPETETERADGENFELILNHKELVPELGISKEDKTLPLNDEVAYTKLEKVENCEVIPDLKGLVHPEFSITEMDYQCESANVKDIFIEDETSHLNDEAADAELDKVEGEVSPLNDEAADTKLDKVENSSLKPKFMTNLKKRSILIHGTPIRPVIIADMKENSNVHLKRELNVGDATAVRPLAKRKALGELPR